MNFKHLLPKMRFTSFFIAVSLLTTSGFKLSSCPPTKADTVFLLKSCNSCWGSHFTAMTSLITFNTHFEGYLLWILIWFLEVKGDLGRFLRLYCENCAIFQALIRRLKVAGWSYLSDPGLCSQLPLYSCMQSQAESRNSGLSHSCGVTGPFRVFYWGVFWMDRFHSYLTEGGGASGQR